MSNVKKVKKMTSVILISRAVNWTVMQLRTYSETLGFGWQAGLPDFCWYMIPKPEKMNTKCTKWSRNIPNVHKILQMAIKYINIFQSKVLQNFPKLGVLVWKQTIWPPWWQAWWPDEFVKKFAQNVAQPIFLPKYLNCGKEWPQNAD
jgi:hypothetical protein